MQLHSVYDPFSGAHIGAYLYPAQKGNRRVPLKDVQSTLRRCFTAWGTLPDEVQTDGEPVLTGKPGDGFPAPFTLWLAGLGIHHRVTHPGRPTENGGVERAHRTKYEYGLRGQTHLERPALQAHLLEAIEEFNGGYPSQAKGCMGRPPLVAHPELRQPLHPYQPELEAAAFDLGQVDAYLAALEWERKVGKTGQITLQGQHEYYALGRKWAGRWVKVRFDPQDRCFVAFQTHDDGQLQELQRWPARQLEPDHLLWPGQPDLPRSPQQLPLPFPGLTHRCIA